MTVVSVNSVMPLYDYSVSDDCDIHDSLHLCNVVARNR
jgi:hypothetical protein